MATTQSFVPEKQKEKKAEEVRKEADVPMEEHTANNKEPDKAHFGPWMLVSKPQRRGQRGRGQTRDAGGTFSFFLYIGMKEVFYSLISKALISLGSRALVFALFKLLGLAGGLALSIGFFGKGPHYRGNIRNRGFSDDAHWVRFGEQWFG